MLKLNLTVAALLINMVFLAQFEPLVQLTEVNESVFGESTTYGDINNDGIKEFVNIHKYQLQIINLNPDGSYVEHISTHNLPNSSQRNQILDMDNDGDMDLSNGQGWLENLEDTGFYEAAHYIDVTFSNEPYIFPDLNGDGSYDVISYDGISFNNGIGDFALSSQEYFDIEPGWSLSYPSVSDIDNDGDNDLCTSDPENYPVSIIWLNDGSGHFSLSETLDIRAHVQDINDDGFADFLGQSNAGIHIRLNDQQGGFTEQIIVVPTGVDITTGYNNSYLSPAYDYDLDGDLDIIADNNSRDLYLIKNENNTFTFEGLIATQSTQYYGQFYIMADINNDGLTDITRMNGYLFINTQNPDGTFSPYVICGPGVHSDYVYNSNCDIDNDGDEDLLSKVMGGLGVYENINNDHLANIKYIAIHPAENLLGFTDFNGDGLTDMVSTGSTSNNATRLSYNKRLNDGSFGPSMEILTTIQTVAHCLFDVDMDGEKDIVYYCQPGYPTVNNNLTLRWQKFSEQDGLSAPIDIHSWPVTTGSVASRRIIISGDFNGDGFEDLFTCGNNGLIVFESDGAGNLELVQVVGTTSNSYILQGDASDFNGDNIVDIPFYGYSSGYKLGYISYTGLQYTLNLTLLSQSVTQNMTRHGDLDADGDEDIIYGSYSTITIMLNNGAGSFEISQTNLGFANPYFSCMTLIKINEDELPDIVVGVDSDNYDFPVTNYYAINDIIDSYRVECTVFIDQNANGVMDLGEVGMPHRQIHCDGYDSYNFTNDYGQTTIWASAGPVSVQLIQDESVWNPSTPWAYTVELDEANHVAQLYFGVAQDGIINDITGDITPISGICGGPAFFYLSVVNEGNTALSGIIEYTLGDEFQFTGSTPAPILVDGPVLTYAFQLNYGESFQVQMHVVLPNWTFAGQAISSHLHVTCVDPVGEVLDSDDVEHLYTVRCSCDPNDKSVDKGYTNAGYIFNDEELEYTIRFENTGNAEAYNIWIEDDLSDKLDWSSLQLIGYSHPVEMNISPSGRLTFTFANIHLPDSLTDPENSGGFVRYRIKMIENLLPWEVITNKADIIFDYNPAIVTNTTTNTIYDCVDLQQGSVSIAELCPGEIVLAENTALFITDINWYYNDQLVGSSDSIEFTPTTSGQLRMEVSNELCASENTWDLVVNSTNTSFTQQSHILTAIIAVSYQWYLNNEVIEGATSQSYEILETGNYSVAIINEYGCENFSENQFVTFIAIDDIQKPVFSFGPNPAKETVVIKSSCTNISSIVIIDMLGKVVISHTENNSGNSTLDVSSLAAGIYSVQVNHVNIGKLQVVK